MPESRALLRMFLGAQEQVNRLTENVRKHDLEPSSSHIELSKVRG